MEGERERKSTGSGATKSKETTDQNLAIETAGTKQRGVEDVSAIRAGKNLGQQLRKKSSLIREHRSNSKQKPNEKSKKAMRDNALVTQEAYHHS
jgi:hypothetical protein